MAQTIILDLDGTILEGRHRHYACYAGILHELGRTPLSLPDYWRMKRRRTPLATQLAASDAASLAAEFSRRWQSRIEQDEFLALDVVPEGVPAILAQWQVQGHRLLLATLRHNTDGLHKQLSNLGLTPFFASILVCPHNLGASGKAAAVRTALAEDDKPENWLWIGDTEIDIMAARELGCRVCALTSGLRTADYLAQFAPDDLVLDLSAVRLP